MYMGMSYLTEALNSSSSKYGLIIGRSHHLLAVSSSETFYSRLSPRCIVESLFQHYGLHGGKSEKAFPTSSERNKRKVLLVEEDTVLVVLLEGVTTSKDDE